jgi:hypothetical protein
MAEYKVLSNLDHDDHSFKVGDVVDDSVLGDSAQALVADGVIESLGLPVETPAQQQVATESEAVAEAPATPAPLEGTSDSPSNEPQEPVSEPAVEQTQPVQESTPEQPTAAQIEQDLQSLENPSEPSNDLHIS